MTRSGSSSSGARRLAGLLLVLALLAPGPARAAADGGFGERYLRAEQLYDEGRYQESIAELRAAYAIKPLPRLLLNIGQLHLKLRQPREAIAAYEDFRRTSPAPPPDVEATLQAGLAQARAMLPPPAPVVLLPRKAAPPRPPLVRRWWFWGGVGLIAAGVATGVALGVTRPERQSAPGDIEVLDVGFRALEVAW